MEHVVAEQSPLRHVAARARGRRARALVYRFTKNYGALLGIMLLFLVATSAIFAPVLAPYPPNKQDIYHRLKPPAWQVQGSRDHLLGTDQLGRDLFSRIIYGSRISLVIGLVSVVLSGILGTTLGMLAGYYGRKIDSAIMRIADVQLAFPFILLAIAIIAVLRSGLRTLIVVMIIGGWVNYARVARGEVLAQRSKEYVEAARVIGARDPRIIARHIFPNILSSITVIATLQIAFVILAEAGLSFLGLGVKPSIPTWGGMLNEGRSFLTQAWWVATFPGLAIMITVLGVNLVGDALRDILDPRTYKG